MANAALVSTLLCALTLTTTAAFADDETLPPAPLLMAIPGEQTSPLTPAPDRVGYQMESGVASTYVFRGRPQYADKRDASSQSTAALTVKRAGPGDLTLSAWNATALTTAHAQPGTATEVDLTASYAYLVSDKLATNTGYIAYLYPNHTVAQHFDGAHELFESVSAPNGVITPSIGVYAEMVRLRGAYTTAGLSRTFEKGKFTFTPSASAGLAAYDGTATRLNDLSALLTAQWNFAEPAYVNLRLAYSYMGGKASDLPGQNGSFAGRSAPWGMLAFGLTR